MLYTVSMKRIAVIGTGIMGSGIAANYLKAGYSVAIWNRSPDKTTELQKSGATLVSSPKEAAEQADIVFEVTADDSSSQAVWQGPDGILAGADNRNVLIASGTFSAQWTEQLSEMCHSKGYDFLDMPLTGGRVAAEGGSLTLLVGGDQSKLEAIKPDLEAISSKVVYFGPASSGMKYKLILNSLQASHLNAFGEAMLMAKSQGLDLSKVGPALCDRPGGVITNIAWAAYQQADIPLTFSVDWILKDLKYAKQLTDSTQLPILDDVIAAYNKAQAAGHGEEDWAVVIKQ
ncbi:MAG: NAD(P)-dependent oxidoreductase [Patescibacteria group bacterium]